jgi:hypothetical protein
MVGVIVRIIMSLAAAVTGWFVTTTDSARFDVVQMVVALLLIALFVSIAAFWNTIVGWFETRRT